MSRGLDVLVVGSVNADAVLTVPTFPLPGETVRGDSFSWFCGGKGANQAVAVGKLRGRCALAACVGADDRGRLAVAELERHGVSTEHVRVLQEESTGIAVVSVDRAGQNTVVLIEGANRRAAFPSLPRAVVVLCQNEISLESTADALELAKSRGSIVVWNPAPAPSVWSPLLERCLAACDYLTPNETELLALARLADPEVSSSDLEAQLRALRGQAPCAVLIATLGGEGVRVLLPGRADSFAVAAAPATVLDTTGAGDCLSGVICLLLARHGREDLEKILRLAMECATLACTRRGAQASYPAREEVSEELRAILEASERA